ncbi:hypothetical protein NDU88_007621 [Pleurodeles waltl]|uniref:Uncharacterized protein n=1 Tax=Pleurodeles waltl TaxID=8319 RepID=A0AAV7VQ92_PLEWA|nr:hypothetical protein NDU88_007621 [Pleurodeles waltl]
MRSPQPAPGASCRDQSAHLQPRFPPPATSIHKRSLLPRPPHSGNAHASRTPLVPGRVSWAHPAAGESAGTGFSAEKCHQQRRLLAPPGAVEFVCGASLCTRGSPATPALAQPCLS